MIVQVLPCQILEEIQWTEWKANEVLFSSLSYIFHCLDSHCLSEIDKS